jgi:RNA polymerase sigma-70 factor (ECF subfamily)
MTVDLVAAARGGDRRAFEALLLPLIQPAYGVAFAMLGTRDEAEDAVQEAALKAWRAAHRLRPGTLTIRPWFLAIVANECRTLRRGRWRSVLRLPELPLRGALERDLAAGLDLRRALDRLPADQRLLLYLFFVLDLPLEEVGAAVGLSPAAVKARLYRVTRRLRPTLEIVEMPR